MSARKTYHALQKSLAKFRAAAGLRLASLRRKFALGEPVDVNDLFDAAGLNPLQQFVILRRVAGETAREIAGQCPDIGRSAVLSNVKRSELRALARLGLDGSIATTFFAAEHDERVRDMREAWWLVEPTARGVDFGDDFPARRVSVRCRRPDRREVLQHELGKLADEWLRSGHTRNAERLRERAERLGREIVEHAPTPSTDIAATTSLHDDQPSPPRPNESPSLVRPKGVPVMPRELTKRQKSILAFVRWWMHRKGYAPSLRQIGQATKIGTPNGVLCHLKALETKGYIRRDKGVCRGMKLLEAPDAPVLRLVTEEDFEPAEGPDVAEVGVEQPARHAEPALS
jgi:hypothetical protein